MAAPCVPQIIRGLGLKLGSTGHLRVLLGNAASIFQNLHPRCIRKYSTPQGQSTTLRSTESPSIKWQLMSAVCLERYPVVSQDRVGIEQEYGNLLETVELENSLLSDHEMQVAQHKERMRKKESGVLDDEGEEGRELITALDLEDQYTEEFNKFTPASRISDTDDDLRSIQRKLTDKLVLLVKCRVGDKSLWMMPQDTRQDGETMRQVAERVLLSQCGMQEMWRSRLFGNAPCGVFKYVFPPTVQEETKHKGAKIFFYKARLMSGDIKINGDVIEDYAWVTPRQMGQYLIPSYLNTVRNFIVPIKEPTQT